MDTLERFPRAWCDTCGKVRPVTLDVMPANDKSPQAAADIVCDECRSIIATLHAPSSQQQPSKRPKGAAKAREMAGQTLDRLSEPSATNEERQTRKRRLLKGPKEFRDIRDKRAKPKRWAEDGRGIAARAAAAQAAAETIAAPVRRGIAMNDEQFRAIRGLLVTIVILLGLIAGILLALAWEYLWLL
jgi:hypothetical protein